MVARCIFSEWCWLKKETVLKKLYMPTQPVVYLNSLKMAKFYFFWPIRSRLQLLQLTVCQELQWQRQEIIPTSYNQSHPGMNNMAKSTCHIWNSSSHVDTFACTLTFVMSCLYFKPYFKILRSLKRVKISVSCVGYVNVRISHCSCAWFQPRLSGHFGLMNKRSMTLDIPLPHDATRTSCSRVDMCCLKPPCKTRARTEK